MIVCDENPFPHRNGRNPSALCRLLFSCALLVFTLAMTPPYAPSYAAEINSLALRGPAEINTLGRHLEYITDGAWQLKVEDFVETSTVEMQPIPGTVPDFGYTPARIWLRLLVRNVTLETSSWRLFFHANFTQKISVFRIGSDGVVSTLLDLTEDTPFGARPVNYPQMVAPFDLAPGEAATLVVAYYSQGSSRLSMSIETPDSFAASARVSEAKSYVFYGMMLIMIALAIVALLVLRQTVFAAYAGYLGSVFIYVAHADGMAFQYIWPNFPRFNSMASVVAGSGVMVFGGLFAITFLQTARHHPVMHRVLVAAVASVLAVDAILWATDPQLLKRLLVIMISVCTLCFVAAATIAARTRFREVRFYLLAWLAGLIPACLFTARHAFGFEPTFITTYDAVRLALLFDALMMGLAIFDRYNHLRQSAVKETLAHSQRNLALSQRLALLEESYQQVTANAQQREESVKDIAHDLRQPMHALRLSFRHMFSAEATSETDARQIDSALSYMEKLVSERLSGRLSADGSPLPSAGPSQGPGGVQGVGNERAAVELGVHGVLRGIADMFAPEAAAKGLGFRLVLAAPDAEVKAFPLMRVVANLVSNAIKYTKDGRIVIALRSHGTGCRVEVHDTGPGLSGPAFEQALLRNERLERDRDTAEGSGLGLAVVKEIVNANEWRLSSCVGRRSGASIRVVLAGASNRPLPEGRFNTREEKR